MTGRRKKPRTPRVAHPGEGTVLTYDGHTYPVVVVAYNTANGKPLGRAVVRRIIRQRSGALHTLHETEEFTLRYDGRYVRRGSSHLHGDELRIGSREYVRRSEVGRQRPLRKVTYAQGYRGEIVRDETKVVIRSADGTEYPATVVEYTGKHSRSPRIVNIQVQRDRDGKADLAAPVESFTLREDNRYVQARTPRCEGDELLLP